MNEAEGLQKEGGQCWGNEVEYLLRSCTHSLGLSGMFLYNDGDFPGIRPFQCCH